MVLRPLYVEKIMAYADTPFVKILTGVRRCGKSTLLRMIMEILHNDRGISNKQIVYYRFDSMEYEDMTAKQGNHCFICRNDRVGVNDHMFAPPLENT